MGFPSRWLLDGHPACPDRRPARHSSRPMGWVTALPGSASSSSYTSDTLSFRLAFAVCGICLQFRSRKCRRPRVDGGSRRSHDIGGNDTCKPWSYRQRLTASLSTQGIYAAIVIAALARICAVWFQPGAASCCILAAFAWATASRLRSLLRPCAYECGEVIARAEICPLLVRNAQERVGDDRSAFSSCAGWFVAFKQKAAALFPVSRLRYDDSVSSRYDQDG